MNIIKAKKGGIFVVTYLFVCLVDHSSPFNELWRELLLDDFFNDLQEYNEKRVELVGISRENQ